MNNLTARKSRGVARYGEQFDPSGLDATHWTIRQAYESGERVEVTTTYANGKTWVRRGRVGVTTGWRPVFILLPRVTSSGSSDVLGPDTIVTARVYL